MECKMSVIEIILAIIFWGFIIYCVNDGMKNQNKTNNACKRRINVTKKTLNSSQ